MRIINYGLMLGLLAACSGQARADDNVTTELQALKAKLKELQQKVDSEARKTRQVEAVQAKVMPMTGTYKALPVESCAGGKICYKGVTLTFGGWVDLTGIYRSRNIASDTGSVYNFIPYQQAHNFYVPETRFSARQSRFSVLAEGNADPDTHLAGYGEIDFEGAAQTASSVATNSFNPRMRQLSLEVDRTDLGLHFLAGQSWSLNSPGKAGIDSHGVDAPGVIDFESVPGFISARQPGLRVWQDHRARVQARRVRRKSADRLLRRQHADGRHTRGRPARRAQSEPSGQSDRTGRQLLQQPQQCQLEPGA